MPMIELPDKLYNDADEKLDDHGYNSVTELTKYLVRRWNEKHSDTSQG